MSRISKELSFHCTYNCLTCGLQVPEVHICYLAFISSQLILVICLFQNDVKSCCLQIADDDDGEVDTDFPGTV